MGETVQKIMALTAAEFVAGLSNLGGIESTGACEYRARLDDGFVQLTYERLPDATLGGLLRLPRAKVCLVFEGGTGPSCAEFLRRFDLAFQRGGG